YDPAAEIQCLFCSNSAAMTIANNLYLSEHVSNLEKIDMAPMPVWEDLPETTPYSAATPMIITNYSEHQDEAFQVLQKYVSPEIQLKMVKTGSSASVLSDPAIANQFGVESEFYEGKNREAWFIGEPGQYEVHSRWDDYVDIDGALEKLASK